MWRLSIEIPFGAESKAGAKRGRQKPVQSLEDPVLQASLFSIGQAVFGNSLGPGESSRDTMFEGFTSTAPPSRLREIRQGAEIT